MKIIQCDSRQKRRHHDRKEKYFEEQGYKLVHSKMLVGDYCIPSNGSVVVDTKADLTELYGNLIQQHDRFHNECVLAQEAGIKLYILIENKDGIKSVEDVKHWKNPQMFKYYKEKRKAEREGTKIPKPPASNIQLIKIMHSMSKNYGVEFVFTSPQNAGVEVLRLLNEWGMSMEVDAIKASWDVLLNGKNCGTFFGHICSNCGYRFLDVLEETKTCRKCGAKLIYGRLSKEQSEKILEKFESINGKIGG